jgi:prepilin-type N-terminal cleavage/methylation domain-containing protein
MKMPCKQRAFTLIEMMVYISVLVVITGIGFSALYRSMDNSRALRRSSGDITDALHAGENWRADIRAAIGKIQIQSNADEQILRFPGSRSEISYRFANNTVFRRLANNDWSVILQNVKSSSFISETRSNVTAWRWELELQPRAKKIGQIPPLFTFMAVPAGDLSK